MLAGVIEQISLANELSNDVDVLACSILFNKLDNVWVMALLKDSYLAFKDLLLAFVEFFGLNYFYGNEISCRFLFTSVNV